MTKQLRTARVRVARSFTPASASRVSGGERSRTGRPVTTSRSTRREVAPERLAATTLRTTPSGSLRSQSEWARGGSPSRTRLWRVRRGLTREWIVDLESRVGRLDARAASFKAHRPASHRARLEAFVIPVPSETSPSRRSAVSDVRRVVANAAARGLAPSTTSSVLSILWGLLRFAVKLGALERNPERDLDRDDRLGVRRSVSEPRYLDVEEVESLLSKMSDTFRRGRRDVRVRGATRLGGARARTGATSIFAGHADDLVPSSGPTGEHPRRAEDVRDRGDDPAPARARSRASRAPLARGRRSLDRVRPDALVFATLRGKPQSRRNALRVHEAGRATSEREPAHRIVQSMAA